MGPILELSGLLTQICWIWALYDCYQHEPNRDTWLWILLIGNFPGAVVYLLVRKNPLRRMPLPMIVHRWLRRDELADARYGARHIGNAHHFVTLGQVLQETNQSEEAEDAYRKALEKEPKNPEALWGLITTFLDHNKESDALPYLESLLAARYDWHSGEAALLHIRLLLKKDDFSGANDAMTRYRRQWNEPEARFYEARLAAHDGNESKAVQHLSAFLEDMKDSPPYQKRRNRRWIHAAEKMLYDLKTKSHHS